MALPSSLPRPRREDPLSAPVLRWGITGPGWIAERFTRSLKENTRQEFVAVAGHSPDKARAFAARWSIPRVYGSTAELVDDPSVDVLYVATPHHRHYPDALAAIEAGKHVLVEKPLTLNAPEARRLAAACERRGVLCMEAYWTDFLPKFDVLRQVLASGVLGQPRTVLADHGEHFGAEHRIMRPEMAGGPLLDLGTYVVAFAIDVLGPVTAVKASGQWAPSGVNGQASILLTHRGDAQSVLHTTLFSTTPCQAVIAGDAATLILPGVFYAPGGFTITAHDGSGSLRWEEEPNRYAQLYHEAIHFVRCIADGVWDSPVRPLSHSIATLETLDAVRRQLGIIFDEERTKEKRGG